MDARNRLSGAHPIKSSEWDSRFLAFELCLYVKVGAKMEKEKPPAGEATAGGQFLAI